jgi:acyl-CoA reductase-like NAD-dependent aldehyde dehydrogenase
MAQCAAGLKKISLELGGNAPFVVFDDADLDEAVAGTVVCKFRNSGQTCISANRILVQEGSTTPTWSGWSRRFATEEEAVRIANGTPYGLCAYFYSRDVGRVRRLAEGLDYGLVGINTGFVSTEVAPFGGMKESGIGREGSKYGIEDWLELKYLALAGL